MIKLSERLSHLADMVSNGAVLADVGTDHGYIPIYLLQSGKIPKAFAMDIRKDPLQRAKEHTAAFGLGDYITFRLSDGVAGLLEGEADCILIAGMGGNVMHHILQEGEAVIRSAKELVLQPQSDISGVREYLYRKGGYCIDREDMVLEEGKYYPMMHVVVENDLVNHKQREVYSEEAWQVVYRYGECLLNQRQGVLQDYLRYKMGTYEKILEELENRAGEAVQLRRQEVLAEIGFVERAFQWGG